MQVPNLKIFKNEPSQPNKGCIQQKSSPNRTPAWDLDPPPPGVFAAGHLPRISPDPRRPDLVKQKPGQEVVVSKMFGNVIP